LGEVSKEIHNLKSEISALKLQVNRLEKGKQNIAVEPFDEYDPPEFHESNIQIFEGKKDPTAGFQEMRILAIEYQQHHVQVNICIQGEMFSLTALIDSGADVNVTIAQKNKLGPGDL